MFGFDSQGKEFKTALQTAGADMTIVKEWLKTAEKTRKQYENIKEDYEKARASLSSSSEYSAKSTPLKQRSTSA